MIQKIAVIGAGPAGLAAAKYLLAENSFSEIVLFEQRLNVGGVWNATPSIRTDKNFTIPQTRPSTTPGEPIPHNGENGAECKFDFLSPIYDNLDTNIPHMLMKYSDYAFPERTSLFPQHDIVLEYLERYADEIRSLIHFGTQVLDVRPINQEACSNTWSLSVKNIKTGDLSTLIFDAVIVANGHYNDAYIPDIPGIREWDAAYTGSISHSKFYRKPSDFKDKKVIIVGNSASGTDLAAQIAPFCTPPLLISSRSPPTQSLPACSPTPTTSLPEIERFDPSTRSIAFSNGHSESAIDAIVFCTGYLYSFPFLSETVFSRAPPLLPLCTARNPGAHVPHLYQHVFYRPRPTLAFLALPQRIIPFPLSEAQAAVVARVFAGRLALPPESDMAAWESALLEEKARESTSVEAGAGKVHIMGFPADAQYINFLHDWAMSASPTSPPSSSSDPTPTAAAAGASPSRGKTPPYWGAKECWMREQTPLIKKAARELGSPREKAELKTLEDLGFKYVPAEAKE